MNRSYQFSESARVTLKRNTGIAPIPEFHFSLSLGVTKAAMHILYSLHSARLTKGSWISSCFAVILYFEFYMLMMIGMFRKGRFLLYMNNEIQSKICWFTERGWVFWFHYSSLWSVSASSSGSEIYTWYASERNTMDEKEEKKIVAIAHTLA